MFSWPRVCRLARAQWQRPAAHLRARRRPTAVARAPLVPARIAPVAPVRAGC